MGCSMGVDTAFCMDDVWRAFVAQVCIVYCYIGLCVSCPTVVTYRSTRIIRGMYRYLIVIRVLDMALMVLQPLQLERA